MKIDPTVTQPPAEVQPLQNRQPVASVSPQAVPTASSVELSPQGLRLREQVSRISVEPPIHQGRVDAVKLAIAEGRYAISAERIADALLQEIKEQLQS